MPATTEPDSTSASAASSKPIGHYQVMARIGEGGMGEVYRARDTRLNREVAIKVLPRAFADDPMRMARFEREAQLLASLNHPKIAAIYGLEESGATRALVMELVEGPTLAERIGRAPASAKPRADILVKDASGAGSAGLLFKSETNLVPTDWSRDGRYILFARLNTEGRSNRDIWVLPLFGDRKPFPYLATQFDEGRAVFSPDGRWVAYLSDESGKTEVYVSTFPAGGGKWQVSQGGGEEPEWGRDGRNLYYLAPGGKMMEASIAEKGPAVEIGAPHELFALTAGAVNGAGYAVALDGKRFLMVEPAQGESQPLTLVTNWSAGLEK